ncbi:MAG TPA: CBS domain-containing protein [Anaerolineae bacterium]|nr:CBS domain-containing protein [Anaerolineae bacterium]
MEVILTHENTDFDAIAAMLGAAKLYPKAYPVVPRQPNRNVRDFLTLYWEELPFVRLEDLPRRPIKRAILVDTQRVTKIRGLRKDTEIRIIDHHPLTTELTDRMAYRGGDAGATTTILVEEISEAGIPLSPIEATLMLLGIYEDTGSLSYTGTTPRDVRCAAWLLEQGANLDVVNDFLHHPLTDQQRRLYEQLIENAEVKRIAGQSVVIATATASGYVEEISTLAHKVRDLFEPDAAFLLVKLEDRLQLVARSTSDAIDVAEIARHFGGGGHGRAAAALIRDGDLGEAHRKLLKLLEKHVKPRITVKEIMSHGAVRTLMPKTTIAQAAEEARRYGHEGFPVVKDGQLVGIITRSEIDKALQHGLEDATVETYMYKGAISVSPDDSIEGLQQVMMEHGLGQVPVVQEGRIIGIVTRTDLIKLWSAPPRPSRAAQIAQRLERALPAHLLTLLRKASQTAGEMGYSLYIVGGFVRDLLLGVAESVDLDLVVDGDAIALARRLAEKEGGRVHGHARFGTAKWILSPDLSLDFVTARTEFYEHPTALPSVERGSIKSDLHRRDFTINTMAICLDEAHYGQLLDFYGGEQDLERGLIRVLHSLSFVEDPTRILRAVRLEQRLGFRIEERTEELIDDALDLLDRVSGDRIRHELYLIFQEAEPERCLARLEELGVLAQIHPALRHDDWFEERFQRLRRDLARWEAMSGKPERTRHRVPEPILYLALLAFPLTAQEVDELSARLKLPGDEANLLRQTASLRQVAPKLAEPGLSHSATCRLLERYSDRALFLLWVASDEEAIRQRLELYQRELRHVRPELDGTYLKKLGIPPGPIYGRILGALRDARLDGQVTSRAEEEALVQELLAADEQARRNSNP